MSNTVAIARSTAISDLRTGILSTIKGTDRESLNRVYEAVSSAENLSAHIGEPFNISDIISQEIVPEAKIDPATGAVRQDDPYIRITLVGPEGEPSFAASSKGVLNSVSQLFQVYGHPSEWGTPVRVKAVEEGKKPDAYMKLVPAK